MAQEMILNLKLTGMIDLIKSIRDLNRVLDIVNNKFARTAQSITAAAQSISKSVGNMRATVGPGAGAGSRRGNQPGNSQNPSLYDDVVLSKALFGGGKNAKAYLFANIIDKLKNVNVGKPFQGMGTGLTLGGVITKIALPLLILKVAIDLVIGAFKLFLKAINEIAQAAHAQAQLLFASGGNSGLSGRFRAAGFDPSQIAGMIRDPSQGRILEQQLNILRHMDIQSASRFANYMGINPDVAMQTFFKSPLMEKTDQLSEVLQPGNRTNAISNRASADFSDALGSIKNSLSQVWQTLAPVLEIFAMWLKGVSIIIQTFAKAIEGVITLVVKAIDLFQPYLHLEDQLKNLTNSMRNANNELDKFSNKIGTFGGRERAANAIPSAYVFYAYQGDLVRHQNNMGSFGF